MDRYTEGATIGLVKDRIVDHLVIRLAAGHTPTQAIYSSGHNQCKIFIDVIVLERTEMGFWQSVPLFESERDSATVTFFSDNPKQQLSKGWICDKQKNRYSAGVSTNESDDGELELKSSTGSSNINVVERYLRVEPGPVEAQCFMACITVGGKVYTSNFSVGDKTFSSSIVIRPVRPYALRRADLVEHIDLAYRDDSVAIVRVFYYTPPSTIKLIETVGVSSPVSVVNEGPQCKTAAVSRIPGTYADKLSIIVGKDQPGTLLYMNDIQRGVYSDRNPSVRFAERLTILRYLELKRNKWYPVASAPINYVTFRDSSGCDHRFRLSYNTPEIPVGKNPRLTG
ncbi:hypothetical protein C4K03_1107 [Pseudomonas synxantha]|uniref:Uncharacterized protein n=1 Tax=Pseudomonas synxantha TaxID=47883 RepID=A0A3G7U3N3_9PSED|nr:hypothetical protein [Pseudomonas synxantha]AZE53278.1 hypothetical protein C4K03_1107 [Pseudomonas synxantha]